MCSESDTSWVMQFVRPENEALRVQLYDTMQRMMLGVAGEYFASGDFVQDLNDGQQEES